MTAPTTRETADHAELAACPFCGSDRVRIVRVQVAVDAVECGECGSSTKGFPRGRWSDPDEAGRQAIASWNRRPREAALLSEVAALRVALEKTASDFREVAEAHTQAERQRDELRKALELAAKRFETLRDLTDHVPHRVACSTWADEARQANQGADQ